MRIVAGKFKGLQGLMKSKKVTVVDGFGKLTGENTIDVDGTTYTGKHIILASGSYSKTMGIEIRDRVMTSTEALEIDWTPKSAIVLGGGASLTLAGLHMADLSQANFQIG